MISVAATPSLSLVTAACVDRHAYGYDHGGNRLWSQELDAEVWATACTLDGGFAAFGTADKKPAKGTVHITNNAGDVVASFPVGMPVWSLAFSADGRQLMATTWGGECRRYRCVDGHWRDQGTLKLEGAGLYGTCTIEPARGFFAVQYGRGGSRISEDGHIQGAWEHPLAGYNVVADDQGRVYMGARAGRVLRFGEDGVDELEIPNAAQAICGVAVTADGQILYTGSFDGHLRAVAPNGELYWERDLVGEVWSVACSPGGRHIISGGGDGRLSAFESLLSAETAIELRAVQARIARGPAGSDASRTYAAAIELFARLGLYAYALRYLADRRSEGELGDALYDQLILQLASLCEPGHTDAADIAFEQGQICRRHERHWDAGIHFLKAARNSRLRLRAFSEAASEFRKAQHPAAALACFRRAREAQLASDDLKIIYTLARSFEDKAQHTIARDHLDMIMAQDPNYRDVASRLRRFRDRASESRGGRIDYTGLTVSLLGPDGPTAEVDPRLNHIVEARSQELNVTAAERAAFDTIIQDLYETGVLVPGEDVQSVDYDTDDYVKYDKLLPEDDVKKKLEAINVINLSKKVDPLKRSLDIGTATGRYPSIFNAMGIEAHGIDVEPRAIEYARRKRPAVAESIQVGDAREIPFPDEHFDLVTCMMGTFFHLELEDHVRALKEMARVCRPGGMAAISTWDIECPHLTFLSMYSVREDELITTNARTLSDMLRCLEEAGFSKVGYIKFALVPDTISYDLGIEDLDMDGLRRLLELDVATRAALPNKHGQMFIAYGVR